MDIHTLISLTSHAGEHEKQLSADIPCIFNTGVQQEWEPMDYLHIYVQHMMQPVTVTTGVVHAIASSFTYINYIRKYCDILSFHLKHICGYIISPQMTQVTTVHTWSIKIIQGYITNIMYNRLEMIYSKECEIASLQVNKYFTKCIHQEVYCGHLPPWHEMCPCQSISIAIDRYFVHAKTEFSLVYSASRNEKISVTMTTHIILGESIIPLPTGWNKQVKQLIFFLVYSDHKTLIHLVQKGMMSLHVANNRGKSYHAPKHTN